MSSSNTLNEPVITSYAKAPARTITAGGVTYAYRELGPKDGQRRRRLIAHERGTGHLQHGWRL